MKNAKWNPPRIEQMTQMLAAGKSPFEVATTLGGLVPEDVVVKASELGIVVPVSIPESVMDDLIDDLVRHVDYDTWKDSYNADTAEDPELVEDNRDALKGIIFSHGA